MENKVNKILSSIAPTRREKLSKQREVKLALMDDLREHTNQLEELEYGDGYEALQRIAEDLNSAINDVKRLAAELEPQVQPFADNDYDSMVSKAEADIAKYESAIEELGLPMDDEVEYLRDVIISDFWYGNGERSFNEEPNWSFLINEAKKLD